MAMVTDACIAADAAITTAGIAAADITTAGGTIVIIKGARFRQSLPG